MLKANALTLRCVRGSGFTLLELIVVLAIIGILVTIGLPSFRDTIRNNRVTSHTNEMVSVLSFAKSEAVRRSADVAVQLRDTAEGWEARVFLPGDGPTNCLRCSSNRRVGLEARPSEDTAWGAEIMLTFNNRGYLSDSIAGIGTVPEIRLTHDGCAGTRQRRLIGILPSGQLVTEEQGCG